jgi:hypothetical protein
MGGALDGGLDVAHDSVATTHVGPAAQGRDHMTKKAGCWSVAALVVARAQKRLAEEYDDADWL